jgi:putative RecB family exonuclease
LATVYSHSRLSSYENCPRQFHYRYIEKRPIDTESIEAFVGKRVHEVLERLHQFVDRGQIPSLGKVVARFRADWEQHFDGARVRTVRAENSPESYLELGTRCLSNYYRRHYPFDHGETLSIEARIAFPLDAAGRYRIQGFVDRIVRAPDGAVEIHDYKTGRWVPSQAKLDSDRQLALYQLGFEARNGRDAPVRLVWHFLQRDQMRVSTRTREQLDALCGQTIALIDRIEAEHEFAPKPSALCSWCEHNDVCPAMAAKTGAAKSRAAAEEAPAPVPARAAISAPTPAPGGAAEAPRGLAREPDTVPAAARAAAPADRRETPPAGSQLRLL